MQSARAAQAGVVGTVVVKPCSLLSLWDRHCDDNGNKNTGWLLCGQQALSVLIMLYEKTKCGAYMAETTRGRLLYLWQRQHGAGCPTYGRDNTGQIALPMGISAVTTVKKIVSVGIGILW